MTNVKWLNHLDIAVLIGLVLSVLSANLAVFGQDCATIRSDVLRLHIIANSDSESDQAVKLAVRDSILSKFGGLFEATQTLNEAKLLAESELSSIEKAACDILDKNGYDTTVNAEICNMYFGTRVYDTFSLPAGYYDAIRVTIGAGVGHNWWCVMYPPLCLPSATVKPIKDLSDPTGAQIAQTEIEKLNDESMFKPKLAIVELFENLFK